MPLNLRSSIRTAGRTASRTASVATVAIFFLAGAISGAPPAKSITNPGSTGVEAQASLRSTELLKDLQVVSSELNRHAETLGTFANRRGELSWQSHAMYLAGVRESINEAGLMLMELQDLRHSVAPWQRLAIDNIHPVALQLVDHTEAAIEHLNEYQGSLWMPQYTERLFSIADHASDMKSTVDKFVEYGEAQRKLENLEDKLEQAAT